MTEQAASLSGLCDLHTHSTYSDGTDTPRRLVEMARQIGLGGIALTDHNTVGGLESFMQWGEKLGVRTVPGVELSTRDEQTELHVLALFLPRASFSAVEAYTDAENRKKEERNLRLARRLNAAGYAVDYAKIKAKTDAAVPNRAHFATELVELGYFDDVWQAFSELLGEDAPFYEPSEAPDTLRTIAAIREWGAVSVLAHPLLDLTPQRLERFLQKATAPAVGLCGMETHYSCFSAEQTAYLDALCARFDILPAGGSDYHGARKPDIALGSGKGALAVPLSFMERLAHQSVSAL